MLDILRQDSNIVKLCSCGKMMLTDGRKSCPKVQDCACVDISLKIMCVYPLRFYKEKFRTQEKPEE